MTIEYQPFPAPSSTTLEAHPWYLKEYRGRWYAFSWVERYQNITNLAIDRIVSVQANSARFKPNTFFDPKTYFIPIVGVTLPEEGNNKLLK